MKGLCPPMPAQQPQRWPSARGIAGARNPADRPSVLRPATPARVLRLNDGVHGPVGVTWQVKAKAWPHERLGPLLPVGVRDVTEGMCL
jgi:hypothetical protein